MKKTPIVKKIIIFIISFRLIQLLRIFFNEFKHNIRIINDLKKKNRKSCLLLGFCPIFFDFFESILYLAWNETPDINFCIYMPDFIYDDEIVLQKYKFSGGELK